MGATQAVIIHCRSKISSDCYDGVFEHDNNPDPEERAGEYPDGRQDDPSWEEATDTVVCEACYIEIGQPAFTSNAHLNGLLRQRDALDPDYDG